MCVLPIVCVSVPECLLPNTRPPNEKQDKLQRTAT